MDSEINFTGMVLESKLTGIHYTVQERHKSKEGHWVLANNEEQSRMVFSDRVLATTEAQGNSAFMRLVEPPDYTKEIEF